MGSSLWPFCTEREIFSGAFFSSDFSVKFESSRTTWPRGFAVEQAVKLRATSRKNMDLPMKTHRGDRATSLLILGAETRLFGLSRGSFKPTYHIKLLNYHNCRPELLVVFSGFLVWFESGRWTEILFFATGDFGLVSDEPAHYLSAPGYITDDATEGSFT